MELEDRIPKASVAGAADRAGFRNHQHFNWLAGLEGQILQNEFAVLTYSSLSPVCFHSIEDVV